MKGIRAIELLSEIKANLVAFISIAMFVALGIGLFLGIQWGGVAIRDVANETFETGAFHDIEAQFPYGITDDDMAKVLEIEGVSEVEPGFVDTVRLASDNECHVIRMQSLTERIDKPTVMEGELPDKANEVALLDFWAEKHSVNVGDTITFKHDASDDGDKDGMAHLTGDSYTVVGLVRHPAYISSATGTLGVATIGSGSIDCVAFASADSFDRDAYFDGYPCLYIRCDALRGLDTYSKEYDDKLAPIAAAITELGGRLGNERYNKLHDEFQDRIDEASKQLKEGEKNLSEGKDQIDTGDKELAEGKRQYDEGEAALAEGKQELDEGEDALAEGEEELDSYDSEFAEGERQVSEGQNAINEGKRKLNEGSKELERRRAEGESQKAKAEREFTEAKKKLDDGQAEYDKAKAEYDQGKQLMDGVVNVIEPMQPSYESARGSAQDMQGQHAAMESDAAALDSAVETYKQVDADPNASEADKDAAWADVESAYQSFSDSYDDANESMGSFSSSTDEMFSSLGVSGLVNSSLPELAPLDRSNPDAAVSSAHEATESLGSTLNTLETPVYENYNFYNIPEMVDDYQAKFDQAEADLADAKQKLDDGRREYDEKKAEYDKQVAEGERQLKSAEGELAKGRKNINEKQGELDKAKSLLEQKRGELDEAHRLYDEKLEELQNGKGLYSEKLAELFQAKLKIIKAEDELAQAKKTYEEKLAELEKGKADLADAEQELSDMLRYEWVVMPRIENGGAEGIDTVSSMMDNVRWAMASLFVLVGLFVCYSAVSRLVNDEVVQVGTKKAMGFREGEIARGYLSFSGLAVLAGTLLAGLIGVFMVQGIMNPKSAATFVLPAFGPHFNLVDLLLGGGLEMVLILASTWLACHSLLKRNAVDLLSGNNDVEVKERFFERCGIWQRMSLYSQTIVNNVINDKRRVVATVVGVTACTALIVTAVTLQNNVSRSIERQYDEIYGFNTVAYVDEDSDTVVENASKILQEAASEGNPVHVERMQVRQANGHRTVVKTIVPLDREGFDRVYHARTLDGEPANLDVEGIWVSSAFASHMNVRPGDTVTLTEFSGKAHDVPVAGVLEYYVLQHEFLMSEEQYTKYFNERATTNALLANVDEGQVDDLRGRLMQVDGFDALVNEEELNRFSFDEIASLLTTVVLVYLLLSALMALIVLLNLDIMFVEEKKRELIVLMINGYSAKDAKAYIYRDAIALTVVGILLGIILGSVTGNFTVKALEPGYGYFIKGFNPLAAGIGIVGCAAFSAAVLLYALRRIPRFDLTDINRF